VGLEALTVAGSVATLVSLLKEGWDIVKSRRPLEDVIVGCAERELKVGPGAEAGVWLDRGQANDLVRESLGKGFTVKALACALQPALNMSPTAGIEERAALARELAEATLTRLPRALAHVPGAFSVYAATELQGMRTKTEGVQAQLSRVLAALERSVSKEESDLVRLLELTGPTLKQTLGARTIGDVHVERGFEAEIGSELEHGPLLIVGSGGVGKTAALAGLAQSLLDEGKTVLFATAPELLRIDAKLKTDVVSALGAYVDREPAYLLIDGVDRAPDQADRARLTGWVREVNERHGESWRVACAVRAESLLHDHDLMAVFAGKPAEPAAARGLERVRHIWVPELDLTEASPDWDALKRDLPRLAEAITGANDDLRRVVENPFCLSLLWKLLSDGESAGDLREVRSIAQLLDLYWEKRAYRDMQEGYAEHRSVDDLDAEFLRALEVIAPTAVGELDLQDAGNSMGAVRALCSSGVLVGVGNHIWRFRHDILFEYAIARVLLSGKPSRPAEFLMGVPLGDVWYRGALELHFAREWGRDSTECVRHALEFAASDASRLAKSVAGAALARGLASASDIEALGPLWEALGGSGERRAAAEALIEDLVFECVTGPECEDRGRQAPPAPVWVALGRALSEHASVSPVAADGAMSMLLRVDLSEATDEQRSTINGTARTLLEYARVQSPKDTPMVPVAIEAIAVTHQVTRPESFEDLKACLQRERIAEVGWSEVTAIAEHIRSMFDLPDFVVAVYEVVFGHNSAMADRWPADYQLAWAFGEFLAEHPTHGVKALAIAVEGHLERIRGSEGQAPPGSEFAFRGGIALIQWDRICMWDAAGGSEDEPVPTMLHAFRTWLVETARSGDQERLATALETVGRYAQWAVIWKHVLRAAADAPEELGLCVADLVCAAPVLACRDTTYEAGVLLNAVHPLLDRGDREAVERSLTALDDGGDAPEPLRRLIGCLDPNLVVLREVRGRRAQLVGQAPPEVGQPLVSFDGPYLVPETREEQLEKERGREASVEEQRLLALVAPARRFAEGPSSELSAADVGAVLPALQELRAALDRARGGGCSDVDTDEAWGWLAIACQRIAGSALLADGALSDVRAFVLRALLDASKCEAPRADPPPPPEWDAFCGWPTPAPRVDAATGLLCLARFPDLTEACLPALQRLRSDPRPEVRLQVARWAYLLMRVAPEAMWDLVNELTADERPGVRRFLVAETLTKVVGVAPAQTEPAVLLVWGAAGDDEKVRGDCAALLACLWLWHGLGDSRAAIVKMAGQPDLHGAELGRLAWELVGIVDTAPDQETRQRAASLLSDIACQSTVAASAAAAVHARASAVAAVAAVSGRDQRSAAVRLLDNLGDALRQMGALGDAEARHHLLDALDSLLPLAPERVLLVARDVLSNAGADPGRTWRVPSDAARLVERVVKDHEGVFESDECVEAAWALLDQARKAGVRRAVMIAGWLSAAARRAKRERQ